MLSKELLQLMIIHKKKKKVCKHSGNKISLKKSPLCSS